MTIDFEENISLLARGVCSRGLAGPAVFFLELHKPLTGVLREIALLASPMFVLLFGRQKMDLMNEILESPDKIELLIQKIEELARKPEKN